MLIIGLTGGIASGKSFVAALLAENGAVVMDADQIAHDVLADPQVLQTLADRWGTHVIKEDGSPNRSEIGIIVFADNEDATAEKKFLEQQIHPRVRKRIQEQLEVAQQEGKPAAILDIPLLHESSWDERCDLIIHVDTPLEVRQARAAARGWSSGELAKRESTQLPVIEKRQKADHFISGECEKSARADLLAIWKEYISKG